MVGSWFFLRYRADWEYTGVYDMLYRRNLNKLAKSKGIDLDKAQALKTHIEKLEGAMKLFK